MAAWTDAVLEGSVVPGHSYGRAVSSGGRSQSRHLNAGAWEVSHHLKVMLPLLIMSQPAELPQKQGVVPFVLKDKG